MNKVQYARLKFDYNSGEGEVVFMNGFEHQDWVTKADALKDWIYYLETMYNALLSADKEDEV